MCILYKNALVGRKGKEADNLGHVSERTAPVKGKELTCVILSF